MAPDWLWFIQDKGMDNELHQIIVRCDQLIYTWTLKLMKCDEFVPIQNFSMIIIKMKKKSKSFHNSTNISFDHDHLQLIRLLGYH